MTPDRLQRLIAHVEHSIQQHERDFAPLVLADFRDARRHATPAEISTLCQRYLEVYYPCEESPIPRPTPLGASRMMTAH